MKHIQEATLSLYHEMRSAERKQFLAVAEPLANKEPETKVEKLKRLLGDRVKEVKREWQDLSEEATLGDIAQLRNETSSVWALFNRLEDAMAEEQRERLRTKVKEMAEAGWKFDMIVIDGETFRGDGEDAGEECPF